MKGKFMDRKMKLKLLPLVLCVALAFTGCGDTELYQRLFIKGIAVDKDGDSIVLTIRSENFDQNEEGIMTAKGASVYDAMNNLSLSTGKKQMYSHSYYIIYGKELAENEIKSALDFFIRYYKTRPSVDIFLADGNAADILKVKKDDKLIPSEHIQDLRKSETNSGQTVSINLLNFVAQSMDLSQTAVMPIIEAKEDTLAICGSAVFCNYQLKTELSNSDTMGFLLATGQAKGGTLTAKSADLGTITAEIGKCDTKADISSATSVNLTVSINCSLASLSFSNQDILYSQYKQMEALLALAAKEKITSAIDNSYQSGGDILNIGYKLYKNKTADWRLVEDNWGSEMKNLNFNVTVNVNIRRIGEEDRPSY